MQTCQRRSEESIAAPLLADFSRPPPTLSLSNSGRRSATHLQGEQRQGKASTMAIAPHKPRNRAGAIVTATFLTTVVHSTLFVGADAAAAAAAGSAADDLLVSLIASEYETRRQLQGEKAVCTAESNAVDTASQTLTDHMNFHTALSGGDSVTE